MRLSFTKLQWRVLAACIVIYTAAYLNRLNLTAALSSVIEALEKSPTQGGFLQTAFAIVYAAGQMVNGMIVDRVDPVRHMKIGIAGSGICNILIGSCSDYIPMVGLCMLNGLCQSMLWMPIIRMIVMHFKDSKARKTANIIISLALILGHLGAWAISGFLSGILSWRYSFWVPALLVIPALVVSSLLFRGVERATGAVSAEKAKPARPTNLMRVFVSSGFLFMLLGCVLYGFVRDGIKTWTPTILNSLSNGDVIAATGFSLIIPVINAGGMLIAYIVQRKNRVRNRRLIAVFLVFGSIFCLPLLGFKTMLISALFLGLCCACMAGLEPVLTGLVPIEYERENLVGMTAGLIDCLIYVGSALAGVLAGMIFEGNGVNALYICWGLAALIGAACSLVSGSMMSKYNAKKSHSEHS